MIDDTNVEIAKLKDEIKRGTRVISLSGLTSTAAKAFVLSRIQAETGKTFVVVTDSNTTLEAWSCDLDFWKKSGNNDDDSAIRTPHSAILSLPSFETDIYSGVSPHAETEEMPAPQDGRVVLELVSVL